METLLLAAKAAAMAYLASGQPAHVEYTGPALPCLYGYAATVTGTAAPVAKNGKPCAVTVGFHEGEISAKIFVEVVTFGNPTTYNQ